MVVFAKRSPPPSSKSPSFRVLNGSVDKAKQSLVQKLALREKKAVILLFFEFLGSRHPVA